MGEPLAFASEEGKIVAVLLPVRDEDQLELILSHSSEFRHILRTGKQQIRDGKGITRRFLERFGNGRKNRIRICLNPDSPDFRIFLMKAVIITAKWLIRNRLIPFLFFSFKNG